MLLDGRDVSGEIRTAEVTSVIHHVADNSDVRSRLVELQRRAAQGNDIVSEGRDQGTVVFPDADCKFFLTAPPEERARRRLNEYLERGQTVSLAEVLDQQNQRDQRDATRPMGRLLKAADAIEVDTAGMHPDQIVQRLEQIVRGKMGE